MKIVAKLIFIALLMCFVNHSFAQLCTDNGNVWNKSWESCQTSENPNPARGTSHWFSVSFDQLENIDSTHIWNANISGESSKGVKNVIIDYTTDGATWIELGTFTFPKADESLDYEGFEGPNFGGIWVKEIVFTATENYDTTADCVALAEVQIKLNPDACYGTIDVCGRCDGEGETVWYQDNDGNGLGDPTAFVTACTQPDGFVDNKDDTCDNGLLSWESIGPLFQNNGCNGCHGGASLGGLNLETYENFEQGGNKCGSNITSGTTLIDIIQNGGYAGCDNTLNGQSMNARVGFQMDATEIATIQQWINEGAIEDCRCTPMANYALSGTPSMSSLYNANTNASNLIDQIDSNVNTELAHTKATTPNEWVQIDLGLIQSVSDIIIKNRISCCSHRLSNAYVLTSKNPFPDNTDINEALANADFIDQLGNTEGQAEIIVPVNHSARYIRLQKSGNNLGGNAINIRELEIYSGEESMDSDNDGTCDAVDTCRNLDNSLIGTPCDDGNDCTVNDKYLDTCTCAGTPATDSDNDGVCDTLDAAPFDPCTADGSYDGNEPADWYRNNDFDCDADGITSNQSDTNDFDSCFDENGYRNTPLCSCANDMKTSGLNFISSNGISATGRTEGLPDGVATGAINGVNDQLVFKTGYLLKGEEVCFKVGFNNINGVASITMNGYYFKFNNTADITGHELQEVCYPVQLEGEQVITITEAGGGSVVVDGGYYKYCDCAPSDIYRNAPDCRCPGNSVMTTVDIAASNGIESVDNASGLPDGNFTEMLAEGLNGSITYEVPDMSVGDQLCVTMKFNHVSGKMVLNLNGQLFYQQGAIVDSTIVKCIDVYEDGLQTLEITENGSQQIFIDGISINSCSPCVDVNLSANLEGAYDPTIAQMTTALNTQRGILPGQTPFSSIATPTPAGQPYNIAPWNYTGTEGAGWTSADYDGTEVDWVMVSFRTGITSDTEIARTAALLTKDGSVKFVERCPLSASTVTSVYIVLEHRNHIGVMTPQPIDIINGTLTYDFRAADSYNASSGFGQKQLPTGEWVMYAGDSDQSDFPSYDITGSDKNTWTQNNGIFDYYLSPDFNLDGDVNGQDKSIWERNNGISSRVPK